MGMTFLVWACLVVGIPVGMVLDPPKTSTPYPFVAFLWLLITAYGVKTIQDLREKDRDVGVMGLLGTRAHPLWPGIEEASRRYRAEFGVDPYAHNSHSAEGNTMTDSSIFQQAQRSNAYGLNPESLEEMERLQKEAQEKADQWRATHGVVQAEVMAAPLTDLRAGLFAALNEARDGYDVRSVGELILKLDETAAALVLADPRLRDENQPRSLIGVLGAPRLPY